MSYRGVPLLGGLDVESRHRTSFLRRLAYSDLFWAAVLLLPNLIGFLIFMLFPMIASFGLSFVKWDLLTPMQWQGLANYRELMIDPTFRKVLWNTIYYTIGSVPIGIVIAFFLALALNQRTSFVKIYRAIYFLPVITSMVAVGIVWQWVYNPEFGLINYLLGLIGIQGPNWISSVKWAMPAVILVSIWKGLGFNMVLFLAGLQGIPDVYYEAAEIDGASRFAKMWYVTIPLISPTTLFVVIMSIIGSFQAFDLVYVMTRGGPARSTSVLVHYLYQCAFEYFKMGYASAMAYMLFFLVFIVTLIQLWWSKSWVMY